MPELRLTRRAKEDLSALPHTVREAVIETLDVVAEDPESAGKALIGRLRGLRSARVGNYRVLYTIEREGVVVRAIRHRGIAYGSRRSRR